MDMLLIKFGCYLFQFILLMSCFVTSCVYGYKVAIVNYKLTKYRNIFAASLICFITIIIIWPGNINDTESAKVFIDVAKLLIPITAIVIGLSGLSRYGIRSCFLWLLAYGISSLVIPLFWVIDIFSRIIKGYNIIYMQRPLMFTFIHTYNGEITLLSSLFFVLAILSAYAFITNQPCDRSHVSEGSSVIENCEGSGPQQGIQQ